MEGKYIFAIVVLGLFFLLIFVSFVALERIKMKDERLHEWISDRYNNKDVNKYDYDTADEDSVSVEKPEAVVDEAEPEEESPAEVHLDDAYGKIDIEGIEEITGNYKGDK